MTIQWTSSAICWVASVVAHTEDSATSAPTERSMPPPMITNVMPTLTTPMTEASRRIVEHVVDVGEAVAGGDHADGAEDGQRDDQAEVAAHRPGHEARPVAGAPVVAGRAADTSAAPPVVAVVLLLMPRPLRAASLRPGCPVGGPLHDQVEHPVLVERVGPLLGDDRAVGDHQHAVGQAEHLGDLAGDHDDGDAAVGQVAHQRVDLRAGADVDAAGGLVEQQHAAVAQQPAGQDDLLLVAAGQGADLAVDVGRAHVQRRGSAPGPRPARRPGRGSRRGRSGPGWRC